MSNSSTQTLTVERARINYYCGRMRKISPCKNNMVFRLRKAIWWLMYLRNTKNTAEKEPPYALMGKRRQCHHCNMEDYYAEGYE